MLATVLHAGARAQSLGDGETFVFGDSLSDTGSSFAATGGRNNPTGRNVSPNGALYNTGFPESLQNPQAGQPTERFSNGDIHVDRLAGELTDVVGPFDSAPNAQPIPNTPLEAPVTLNPNQTFAPGETGPDGFNFAHGGAQSGMTNADGQNVGFLSQVEAFATLQQGGQLSADPDDTALVFVGGNDFLGAANQIQNAQDPLAAGQQVVQDALQNVGTGLSTLAASGVENFVVYQLPDLSAIPAGQGALQTPQARQSFSQLVSAFNQQLQTQVLGQLEQQGATVRVVDLQALFDDVARQPGAYGVRTGDTTCTTTGASGSVQPTGACQSAAGVEQTTFLDPLHPTARGQEIMAEFAQGSLFTAANAPQLYATAPKAALIAVDGHNTVIDSRLRQVRAGLRGVSFLGQQVPVESGASDGGNPGIADTKISLFVYANHNRGDRDAAGGRAGFDYNQSLLTVGADYEINDALLVGLAGGYGTTNTHADDALGNSEIGSKVLSFYGTLEKGGLYGDLTTTLSLDEHNFDRRTQGPLGKANATAHGQTFSFAINGGYNIEHGPFTFGPTAGLRFLDTEIEDFNEDDAGPLNLEIGDLNAQTAIGSLGAQAAGEFAFGDGGVIAPQLGVSFEHDFTNQEIDVATALNGDRTTTRAELGREDVVILDGGVTVGTSDGLSASLGGRTSLARDGSDYGVRGRLRFTF